MDKLDKKIVLFSSKTTKDALIVYGAGKFQETFISFNKDEAMLLFIELWKFLNIGDTLKKDKF